MVDRTRARGARLVSVQIRPEQPGDEATIGAVHGTAFSEPDKPDRTPVEVALVEQLRASEAWLPGLSLVAIEDDQVVGHVVCSRAQVEGVPALGLGPIGVIPALQTGGIGSRLMQRVITEADAMGEPLIGLLGSPAYYSRFGFVPALDLAVTAPTRIGASTSRSGHCRVIDRRSPADSGTPSRSSGSSAPTTDVARALAEVDHHVAVAQTQ